MYESPRTIIFIRTIGPSPHGSCSHKRSSWRSLIIFSVMLFITSIAMCGSKGGRSGPFGSHTSWIWHPFHYLIYKIIKRRWQISIFSSCPVSTQETPRNNNNNPVNFKLFKVTVTDPTKLNSELAVTCRKLCVQKRYYKNNYRSECIPEGNARTKVIIFCKSRPSNWQLKRIWLQEWLNIGTMQRWVKSFTLSSDFNQCRCLQFRF